MGGCIQRPLASAIIKSHIKHKAPHLLTHFKVSDTWVHNYLSQQLGWMMQKSTRAARKVPANHNELCRAMHAHLTMVMSMYRIHPDFVVNADQTGISLFPTGKYTYEVKGSKDVSVAGHEEKRQVRFKLLMLQFITTLILSIRRRLLSHPRCQVICSPFNLFREDLRPLACQQQVHLTEMKLIAWALPMLMGISVTGALVIQPRQ